MITNLLINRIHNEAGSWSCFYVPVNSPGFRSDGITVNIKNDHPVPSLRIRLVNHKTGKKRNLRVPGRQLEQQQQQPAGVGPQQRGQHEHESQQQLWFPLCPLRPVGEMAGLIPMGSIPSRHVKTEIPFTPSVISNSL